MGRNRYTLSKINVDKKLLYDRMLKSKFKNIILASFSVCDSCSFLLNFLTRFLMEKIYSVRYYNWGLGYAKSHSQIARREEVQCNNLHCSLLTWWSWKFCVLPIFLLESLNHMVLRLPWPRKHKYVPFYKYFVSSSPLKCWQVVRNDTKVLVSTLKRVKVKSLYVNAHDFVIPIFCIFLNYPHNTLLPRLPEPDNEQEFSQVKFWNIAKHLKKILF